MKNQSKSLDSPAAEKNREGRGGKIASGTGIGKMPFAKGSFSNLESRLQLRKEMIVRRANLCYKKWILHGLLRRRELPRTKEGRHIVLDASRGVSLIDERTGKAYIHNAIRSSRYTIWTFLPGQIFFQFSKIANLYFLVIGILQLIPGLSTTGTYTTILPLLVFFTLTIAREGWDDFQRYQLDRVENRRLARVLHGYRSGGIEGQRKRTFKTITQSCWMKVKSTLKRGQGKGGIETFFAPSQSDDSSNTAASVKADSSESDLWATVKWRDLEVGDVVELKRNEQVPADIVLLYADGRDSIAYVETMALDGETNLKNREPPRLLHGQTPSEISNCQAHFVVEDPNLDLYDFNGKVSLHGVTLPLTINNIIYRGSTLRNTTRVIGMVINTGEECKIRMNASKNPQTKAPAIQARTNRVVILMAVFVVLLAIGCTAGYEIWTGVYENQAWYLAGAHLPLEDIFIAFAIEFNNLIPLALYVSLELIKLAQFLLLQDIEMYDSVSNTPMVSNTQNIYENLGQVNYILSDKTGTLTENVMQFRKMSVSGTAWVHSINLKNRADGNERITTNTIPHQTDQRRDSSVQILSTDTPVYSRKQYTTDELLQALQRNSSSTFAQKVLLFLLSLALCHTGFPERKDGEISFQAASPDELALLEAARELGYVVVDRTSHSITLLTSPPGTELAVRETYEVLDVIEFSSRRKRMSIIVKFPDGRICMFCKGADSVILPKSKLASLALQTASRIERVHSQRISREVEDAIVRKSREQESRNSFQRPSLNLSLPSMTRRSTSFEGTSFNAVRLDSVHSDLNSRVHGHDKEVFQNIQGNPRRSMGNYPRRLLSPPELTTGTQKDYPSSLTDDDAVAFEHCLQHLHDFSCEGLRTLIYGYRFINDEEYTTWKKVYDDATTSLTGRQEMIEAAAEIIEQNFNIAGVTGIEDKLQKGVPETIDKLQRANIKIWMLTGDKRETAINIAQSARICKSYSHIIILDDKSGDVQQQIASALQELTEGEIPHSVVIIDGQTLAGIESDEVTLFYDLLLHTDSVICCRASPSQKAAMVKHIRQKVRGSITLAIGDGGNDIAMIQEAHVGVGISGKEGLQAARVADYSIAQFRFLQRLLLVHGHWNYVRTTKYILLTFWKEMLFYSVQVLYQRWNGYTGTSLFESDSLTVWNTLFTALPVMIPGIFEQDLSAATLLAVPELYSYGQENKGFNMRKFTLWMIMAACESVIIYFMIYGLYGLVPLTIDKGLFALGDLGFSVCVIFINIKLLVLQYHYKTWIPIFSALLTISGWWAWNFFLSAIYYKNPGPYSVNDGFTQYFGKDVTWWAVLVGVLAVLIVLELVVDSLKRQLWPSEIDIWQELERDESVRKKLVERGGEGGYGLEVEEGT